MTKLHDTLLAGVRAVEAIKSRYAIVGGLAVGAWAGPRATRDVDLYVELPEARRPGLQRELEARGFHVPAMAGELERFGVFRSRSSGGVFLDIFDSAGPLGAAILDHRRKAMVGGVELWFVAPDELAALKAFSERPRDFEDLVARLVAEVVAPAALAEWARALDESSGTDEVTERVRAATAGAVKIRSAR